MCGGAGSAWRGRYAGAVSEELTKRQLVYWTMLDEAELQRAADRRLTQIDVEILALEQAGRAVPEELRAERERVLKVALGMRGGLGWGKGRWPLWPPEEEVPAPSPSSISEALAGVAHKNHEVAKACRPLFGAKSPR